MKRITKLILSCLLGVVGNLAFAAEAVIYLAPNGDDNATGLSASAPLATLQAAVKRALAQPGDSITARRIVVAPGQYKAQVTVVEDLPDEKPLVIAGARGDRPVFDGNGRGRAWLTLKSATGKPTRLSIEGLEIRNYVTAISLNGERTSPGAWNAENVIRNNIIRDIGQIAFPSGKPSTAAVRLVNSRNNQIVNNHFINIENITGCGALHAIYMAHHSSNNLIEGNTFENGCGATVKARDASNSNIIRNNRFIGQKETLFLDSYCDKDNRDDCAKDSTECPSWGNQVQDNSAQDMGPRARKAPTATKGPDSATGCPAPPANSAKRFSTSNNRF